MGTKDLPKLHLQIQTDADPFMIYIVSGNIVRLIVDHPNYLAGEKQIRIHGKKDEFFRTEEKYQYPPDINPLILSAHKNDHELVQLFLSRGYTIARPHSIDCQCDDCQVPVNIGSRAEGDHGPCGPVKIDQEKI